MTSKEIRQAFLDFFQAKKHQITPSAPMVIKNDPTLMFTNAGMNQFKDIFLANQPADYKRIANTQKCLRVSGKHNDLEEVGIDTYHHTMFEMLGNWSFGDYFKEEAIQYAWEFLVDTLKIDGDRLYATVFEGDSAAKLEWDKESYHYWKNYLPENHILKGSKKDNFWEMGDTGPCGPCSEIHIDLRSDEERSKIPGEDLVNTGDQQIIELWNLVFIQYNRKANQELEPLPDKHVDTGLGLERLCMVVQGVDSNYDTDLFQKVIQQLEKNTGKGYNDSISTGTAMRVVADHLRAIAFSITDGQLPSNNKAGYVIRRILRRAVRYGYTFLDQSDPFIYQLVPVLGVVMGDAFPEIKAQESLIRKVIREEEASFLNTLDNGIKLLDQLIEQAIGQNKDTISGKSAFELYDTYGFPLDLTELILREKQLKVDHKGFNDEMKKQKARSKDDAAVITDDWKEIRPLETTEFVGYDTLQATIKITRYREIKRKEKKLYQLVFDKTPFYAESGGQVGDKGYIEANGEKTSITDTQKENNLIIHLVNTLPADLEASFLAVVDGEARINTALNHTATHLMHYALRHVLGQHVEQKGSLVHPDYLRFDFSHFQKLSQEELDEIETIVNSLIRLNLKQEEIPGLSMEKAMDMGALAFFGEKYGSQVRVIKYGDSVELCGGTHAARTGDIGYFKIVKESAIAAGIRRIEAKSGPGAEMYIRNRFKLFNKMEQLFKTPDLVSAVDKIIKENANLKKHYEESQKDIKNIAKNNLKGSIQKFKEVNVIIEETQLKSDDIIKDLSFELKNQIKNLFLVLGADLDGKAHISVMISESVLKKYNLDANQIIKNISSDIQGGGGGQPFYATAGGKNPGGIKKALKTVTGILQEAIS